MIVRLWMEPNGLRARVTQSLDASDSQHKVTIGTSSEGICDMVKEWVDAFEDRDLQEPDVIQT